MLQDEQLPLDRALAQAVVRSIPADWSDLELRATKSSVSLVRGGAVAWATSDVKNAVAALFALFERHGHALAGFTYRFTRDDDGGWSFVGEYAYA
jgi:hypothetical protein